jgi:membrane associated rhomboid family serine protease
MFPIGDDNSTRKTAPVVVYALIALNLALFFAELNGGDPFIVRWAFVPRRFLADPAGGFVTVFTSMFMHGGWMHLIGNMVFLWVFGNNIEDVMGHAKFVIFYLLCGIAAAATQTLMSPHSVVPMVGASGAISGVLGAYLLLYPRVRVHTLIILPIYITTVALPAWIMLGYWALLQFVSGLAGLNEIDKGGVAFFAHVGGFVAGLVLVRLFASEEVLRRRPKQPESYYRYRSY